MTNEHIRLQKHLLNYCPYVERKMIDQANKTQFFIGCEGYQFNKYGEPYLQFLGVHIEDPNSNWQGIFSIAKEKKVPYVLIQTTDSYYTFDSNGLPTTPPLEKTKVMDGEEFAFHQFSKLLRLFDKEKEVVVSYILVMIYVRDYLYQQKKDGLSAFIELETPKQIKELFHKANAEFGIEESNVQQLELPRDASDVTTLVNLLHPLPESSYLHNALLEFTSTVLKGKDELKVTSYELANQMHKIALPFLRHKKAVIVDRTLGIGTTAFSFTRMQNKAKIIGYENNSNYNVFATILAHIMDPNIRLLDKTTELPDEPCNLFIFEYPRLDVKMETIQDCLELAKNGLVPGGIVIGVVSELFLDFHNKNNLLQHFIVKGIIGIPSTIDYKSGSVILILQKKQKSAETAEELFVGQEEDYEAFCKLVDRFAAWVEKEAGGRIE